jgi:hypothetical protein
MTEKSENALKVFTVSALVLSIFNLFGLLGWLNFLCNSSNCASEATRINWLEIFNVTNANGWSEPYPVIGIPDIIALNVSIILAIIVFRKDWMKMLNKTSVTEDESPIKKVEEIETVEIESFSVLYNKNTVAELKELLKEKEQKLSGNKTILLERAIECGCFTTDKAIEFVDDKAIEPVDDKAIEPVDDKVIESTGNLDIDSVFDVYDANSDGRIEHSEYVAVHKAEGGSGGFSGFVDRLLDDSPELRGQRLWVMFALSVLLVAAMNAYAMVREPEVVKIDDLIQHKNEVVSIEGVVVSWVEDPYSSGEDRVNIIIEDDTGVAQLRWYRFGDIPMIGTVVKATGDVIEYEGRLWLQALGDGAISWDKSDIPEAPVVGISTIAANPEEFIGEVFTITGYISKPVNPNSTFTSLDLRDHPTYGNHEHQMSMIIHSAPGQWLESGQKVEVTAVIEYSQKFLKWSIHTEGPEIRIVRTHTPESTIIGWSNYQTWSYNSGAKVILLGEISGDEIIESGGDLRACLQNTGDISEYEGREVDFKGRLIWSTSYSGWCIDASNSEDVKLIDVSDAENILGQLAGNPADTLEHIASQTNFLVSGVVSGATLMSETGDTKIIIADAVYPNTLAKMDAYVPVGQHYGWLEEGQPIVVNLTVTWNSASSEFQLMVIDLVLIGEPAPPNPYDLSDGAPAFYDLNKITAITGNIVTVEGQTYLQKEGGEQKVRINVKSNSIGLNSQHDGLTMKWTGRLIEIPDDITLAHHYVLDEADVTDEDGNGIADDTEDA